MLVLDEGFIVGGGGGGVIRWKKLIDFVYYDEYFCCFFQAAVHLNKFDFDLGQRLLFSGVDDEHQEISDGVKVFPGHLSFTTDLKNHNFESGVDVDGINVQGMFFVIVRTLDGWE